MEKRRSELTARRPPRGPSTDGGEDRRQHTPRRQNFYNAERLHSVDVWSEILPGRLARGRAA